ncbi:MAG: hypothetical protein RML36_02400 [Anaerolineae bacterium]|nr:hypothetical protein [Anaerolineae bacterium]MDW8098318.1 hypothetical protein [Anaerolineae bacterium]
MRAQMLSLWLLSLGIALLLAAWLGGMIAIHAQGLTSGQQVSTSHVLPPIDVEILPLRLSPDGLAVGETITVTARTAPPIARMTGATLRWFIASGHGTVGCLTGPCDRARVTLFHPGSTSHDTPGIVIGVEYQAVGSIVTDTLSIPLDETESHLPYIRNFTLHFGGKPFPEPGDQVTITLEHALPQYWQLVTEVITPSIIFTNTEAFVPISLTAQARYKWTSEPVFFYDVFPVVEVMRVPFSYDRNRNGIPDLVDREYEKALDTLRELPLVPPSGDPWRALKALAALMFRNPFWPFPELTFDPNCEPCTFGYYQWNGSLVNDIQFCPKAFVTPLQPKVTLCHEMKHWWDEKIVGRHQDHKDVERFGWLCGLLLCWMQHPLDPEQCWTDEDENIFEQMDPPIGPPITFNVRWGSRVTWTLVFTNTNTSYPLENLQFRLKSIMSSGGQYATDETLGGGITVGPNGLADTPAAGDDVPLIPVGQGRPHAIVIQPGPNGRLDTIPSGDDTLFSSEEHITSGADGVVQTAAQGDDVQVIPVGMGYTSTTFMPLAIGAGPNGTLNSSPQGDDHVMPPPSLPIANLQVTTPSSIPAGGQGMVQVAFDVANALPGAPGPGVVQMVFELTALQGEGSRRETVEIFLFLPPKVYLPLIFRR